MSESEKYELPPGSGVDEDETIESENEIHDPFDPSLIRVERTNPTIDLLTNRIKHKEINLSPEFQRKGGIWTLEAQSRLIESILIRIPLPAFYVDATDEDYWLVVDGLQRLTALKGFIVDQTLSLKGLEFLDDLEGYKYAQLPRNFQRRIAETELTIFAIQSGTPEQLKFNIFKRINTGGLPLSPQEIRNALNGQRVREYLRKLAGSNQFLKATRNGIKDKRMADTECVTRFLAFSLHEPSTHTSNDFDAFLNKTMAALDDPKQISDEKLRSLEKKFFRSMDYAYDLLGSYAFRKFYGKEYRLSPINKALFESWSVNLSKLKEEDFDLLLEKKEFLLQNFADLINRPNFLKSISQGTGSPTSIKNRFASVETLISEVLNKND